MTSAEQQRLNFYSKYNRVREKQDIDSLYALIDAALDRTEPLLLALSRSIESHQAQPKQIEQKQEVTVVASLREQEEEERREQEEEERTREMAQKLRRLERMQREFHEELERSEKEQRKKQQAKQAKRRQKEHYRQQLINVIEHTSQHSHNGPPKILPNVNQPSPPHDYDEYYVDNGIALREESEFDVRQTRRKLKEIIQIQRKREREVESVEENEAKTSSIVIEKLSISPNVIERLSISPNVIERISISPQPKEGTLSKEARNYCEVELSHSKSANLLRSVLSIDKIQVQQRIPQAKQQKDHFHYPGTHQYQEINLNYEENPYEQQQQVEQDQNQVQQQQQEETHQSHYQFEYDPSQEVDPPITLAQQQPNSATVEDGSELTEEIADHVVSIGDLSEQQSQPPTHSPPKGPLFFSQAHPKNSFSNQLEEQSIAESIDYHPLEAHMAHEVKSQLMVAEGDKKTSFKKMMAQNRANLVPRLAISTILNQHINQALASHAPVLSPAPSPLHESLISSEGSVGRPGKVNFKSLLKRQKPAGSKVSTRRDPVKAQANKNLLVGFFDQN